MTEWRKPYENSKTRAGRLVGRALQARNARIKARDGYKCQACGRLTVEGEVDHRIPLAKGGTEDDSNLQWLCKVPCHEQKSALERGAKPEPQGCDASGWPVDSGHSWNTHGGEV